jgi:hypothetical protein
VINGQALCAPCNIKKGNFVISERYQWQREALAQFLSSTSPNFLITATPAAGKTRCALRAARRFLDDRVIDLVVVACPTSHLRKQWKDAAHEHFGIQLDHTFVNRTAVLATDVQGVVITYPAGSPGRGVRHQQSRGVRAVRPRLRLDARAARTMAREHLPPTRRSRLDPRGLNALGGDLLGQPLGAVPAAHNSASLDADIRADLADRQDRTQPR